MNERIFLNEVKESVNALWPLAFYHKISDSPIFKGSKMRFTLPKPFDCFFLLNGVLHAVEAKQVRENESIKLTLVEPHQISGLFSVINNGGTGHILLNYRVVNDTEKSNKTVLICPEMWKKIQDIAKSVSAPTFPFEQICQMMAAVEIQRISNPNGKGRIWNLTPIVESLR